MTQTYRTDDGAKWGTGKGSNLTPTEVDINFWDIIQRIITLEALPSAAAGIDHFLVSGTQFYVIMTDSTTLGPYDLPMATFFARGAWATDTTYAVLDTFTINGGLYVVIFAHTSDPTSFDAGANDGFGHDYYKLMIQTPGSSLPTGGATGQVLQKATSSDYVTTWGWKTPTGGLARQYLVQQSSTQDDAEWEVPQADDIEFTPATGSALASNNVADALEEISATIEGGAGDVSYTPPTGSSLTADNVQDAIDELETITQGRRSIWIPSHLMIPRSTNGPSVGTVETSGQKTMIKTLDFDATTPEYAQYDIVMPKSYDQLGITFKAYWSHASTTVNFGVAWTFTANSVVDGMALEAAFFGSQVTDTGGTTDTLYISPENTTILPLAGDDQLLQLRVNRDPTNGSDDMAIDARLHGIMLFYNTNATTDD